MKLRNSQSTLFYRLNLWSAGWPQWLQTSTAIAIFLLIGLVLIVLGPFLAFAGAIMFTACLIAEVICEVRNQNHRPVRAAYKTERNGTR